MTALAAVDFTVQHLGISTRKPYRPAHQHCYRLVDPLNVLARLLFTTLVMTNSISRLKTMGSMES